MNLPKTLSRYPAGAGLGGEEGLGGSWKQGWGLKGSCPAQGQSRQAQSDSLLELRGGCGGGEVLVQLEICATWPELQGPASGSHIPKHFQMDLFITPQPEAALSFFSSLSSPLLEQAFTAPFHSGNQQEMGNVQYCSATAAAWAPGHRLSPRWQQQLTVWGCQQSGHTYSCPLGHLDSLRPALNG